jgi:hypothetical protein
VGQVFYRKEEIYVGNPKKLDEGRFIFIDFLK